MANWPIAVLRRTSACQRPHTDRLPDAEDFGGQNSGGTQPSSWLAPPQIAEGLKRGDEGGVAGVPAEGARGKLVVGLVSGHRRSVEHIMFEFTDV